MDGNRDVKLFLGGGGGRVRGGRVGGGQGGWERRIEAFVKIIFFLVGGRGGGSGRGGGGRRVGGSGWM